MSSTESPETWSLAQKWLQRCIECHKECNLPLDARPKETPTRLIDLGESKTESKPRIYHSGLDEQLHYTVLSYCWGDGSFLKLLTSNLAELSYEIPLAKLPRTIVESFEITRRLGLRYIWVDALCIVQDSSSDWKREAALMGRIYQHAFCSIAALASQSSNGGLFRDRNVDNITPTNIQFSLKDGTLRSWYRSADIENQAKSFSNAALLARGWVMQERFLAPRILYFGEDQVWWECREHFASESYPAGSFAQHIQMSTGYHEKSQLLSSMRSTPRVGNSSHNTWKRLVSHFSKTKLTFPSDRLPAFAGLADVFMQSKAVSHDGDPEQQSHQNLSARLLMLSADITKRKETRVLTRLPEKYVAGLLRSDIFNALLWRVPESTTAKRQSGGPAPSWSWASVEGQISYNHYYPDQSKKPFVQIIDPEMNSFETAIVPESNPTILHILGRSFEAGWDSEPMRSGICNTRRLRFLNPNYDGTGGREEEFAPRAGGGHWLYFDEDPKGQRVLCVPILEAYVFTGPHHDNLYVVHGLVLQQAVSGEEKTGTYVRVGVFEALDRYQQAWISPKQYLEFLSPVEQDIYIH